MLKPQWRLRTQLLCFASVCVLLLFLSRSYFEKFKWSRQQKYWLESGAILTSIDNGGAMLIIDDSLRNPSSQFDRGRIETLSEIDDLQFLVVSSNVISDKEVQMIADQRLQSLTSISLVGSSISNGCLAHLKNFPRLKRLHLNNTKITDDAIEVLGTMQHLEELSIRGTRITKDGFKRLRGIIPKAEIHWAK
jgi:hypothetical protein